MPLCEGLSCDLVNIVLVCFSFCYWRNNQSDNSLVDRLVRVNPVQLVINKLSGLLVDKVPASTDWRITLVVLPSSTMLNYSCPIPHLPTYVVQYVTNMTSNDLTHVVYIVRCPSIPYSISVLHYIFLHPEPKMNHYHQHLHPHGGC